jgi:acetylornithine deacetylase/succinyl-diaminopimelate desuccinylase-like protein
MRSERLPAQRRHTLYFLEEIRACSPVFLDTEVDVSALGGSGTATAQRYSLTAHVVVAAGRVLARHPQANAAIRGRVSPRVARFPHVHAKVTLDKVIGEQRVVLSAVLPDVDLASLEDIQRQLRYFRDGDPDQMAEFAGIRALHRLPVPLGRAGFRRVVRPLADRARRFGTVAVTSLSGWPVDGFYSVGGTTITIGLGQVADRPVARAGQVVIAPVLRLSLTFDHRVIDGAQAADILAELRAELQSPVTDGEQAPLPGAAVAVIPADAS